MLCTDCLENRSSYSKDPDYLTHGFEYQQRSAPSAQGRYAEPPGVGPRSATLCNGTASRSQQDVSEAPQNNNLLEESQHDRNGAFCNRAASAEGQKGGLLPDRLSFVPSSAGRAGKPAALSPPQDDSFHKPVKLARVTSDCEGELTQTLLPNGHTLRASQGESAPLRRASD